MFEQSETHAIEMIYLKCKCGAEFNRECVSIVTDYAGDCAGEQRKNPKNRLYLAELAADEWLEFHKGCYLPSILQVPFNPESLEKNFMP